MGLDFIGRRLGYRRRHGSLVGSDGDYVVWCGSSLTRFGGRKMGFLSTVFKRATPENPSFNLNDPAAWDAFGAVRSGSGLNITSELALSFASWWRGVSLISGDVGKLKLYVLKGANDNEERDTEHFAYRLLRYKPNPYQHYLNFRQQITAHAVTKGNGYAYIDRPLMGRNAGIASALWPLDPDRTYPVREKDTMKVWYMVDQDKGPAIKLEPSRVLHVKGLSNDGLQGYSVVQKAKDALGLGIAQHKYMEAFFKNGQKPGIMLEVPGNLTEQQQASLRSSWDSVHSGVENMRKLVILTNGMKANALSFSNQDSEIIAALKLSTKEVANFLGIPAHKLGDDEKASYSSLEQENQKYLDECLDYWLCNWEAECWDKLLTEEEKQSESHTIKFNREGIVQADMVTKSNATRVATAGKPWMTQNEARLKMGLPKSDDPGADDLGMPLNMGQGGSDNNPKDPNNIPEGDNSAKDSIKNTKKPNRALARLNADAYRRVFKRLAHSLERATSTPKEYREWLDKFDAAHREAVNGILLPVLDMESIEGMPTSARIAEFITGIKQELEEITNTATARTLPSVVKEWAESKLAAVGEWE